MNEMNSERLEIWFEVWKKLRNGEKLNRAEKHLKKIIDMHPQFHKTLNDRKSYDSMPAKDDPFTHLGFHSIVMDMIINNDPQGIRSVYDKAVNRKKDKHAVQHQVMRATFDWMVEYQRNHPDSPVFIDNTLLDAIRTKLESF